MIDIRDLICTAKDLDRRGLKRRAGEMWRRVAIHPDTPADVRDKFWRCVEKERSAYTEGAGAGHSARVAEKARKEAQARAMLKAGHSRKEIAEAMGLSLFHIYTYLPAGGKRAR